MKIICRICNAESEVKSGKFKFCDTCREKAKTLAESSGMPYETCLRMAYDPSFKEAARNRAKRWQQENYPRYIEKYERYNSKLKHDTLLFFSGDSDIPRCVSCGITDIDVLSLDHVNNDGWGNRIDHKKLWKKAQKEGDKSRYQTLCFNCNWKKNIEHLRSKALLRQQKRTTKG
jgi:hypothetical protein